MGHVGAALGPLTFRDAPALASTTPLDAQRGPALLDDIVIVLFYIRYIKYSSLGVTRHLMVDHSEAGWAVDRAPAID
jgi:hypothetical protein